jgi:hypothetical protein
VKESKMQFESRIDNGSVDVREMIENAVSGRSVYTSDDIESLLLEMQELTNIVGFLVSRLSPDDIVALADELGYDPVNEESK